jgi:hypothetical protein
MRPLKIARTVLAVSILVWLAVVGLGYLDIGNPELPFLIGIISAIGITLAALSSVAFQIAHYVWKRRG